MTNKLGVPPLTYDEWMAVLRERAGETPPRRHYGPGPHKSGTSQAVHGPSFGDTVHPVTGRRPTTGYQVGQPTGSMIMPKEDWNTDGGVAASKAFVERNLAVFESDPDVFMGVWLDKDKGEIDLDVSHNIQSRAEAIRQAQAWDQQAIWDNVRGQAINVGGTGAREHAESRHQAAGQLAGNDRGREGRLDPGAAGRGGLRGVDREVVEALERFYRYDADQPRVPKGQTGGGRFGAKGISPGVQSTATKAHEKLPFDAPDGTDWDSMPQAHKDKALAAMAAVGIPDVETQTTNLVELSRTADDQTVKEGLVWYRRNRERLQKCTEARPGDTLELNESQVVSMAAVLSPKNRWEGNLVWAEHAADLVRRNPVIDDDILNQTFTTVEHGTRRIGDDWPEDLQPLAKGRRLGDYDSATRAEIAVRMGQKPMMSVGEAGPDKGEVINTNALMRGPMSRALNIGFDNEILSDADISEYLGGHKTRSFLNNIKTAGEPRETLHPSVLNSVTVDTHQAAASWYGVAAHAPDPSGRHPEWKGQLATDEQKKLLTNGAATALGVKGIAYAPTAEANRRATAIFNRERGLDALPSEFQAVTWVLTIGEGGSVDE